ncbi:MAG: hypothetical protein CMM01_05140 [Rhodopirellula sp.]|nr:hypothetical protein [Rhodopirellula sp.]
MGSVIRINSQSEKHRIAEYRLQEAKQAYQYRIYGQNSSRTANLFPLIYASTITSVFTSH